jgi:hypothetical protein
MTTQHAQSDLAVESFLALRGGFFDDGIEPRSYRLRDKRNTQDDPLDEYVERILSKQLPKGIRCSRAPGALTTPDLVVMRPSLCNGAPRAVLAGDLTRIVALEAKKLERTASGTVARGSGLDYNTTPPCGTVRVYDATGAPLDIRGFYFFVCQEAIRGERNRYRLSALVLCDGNLLNVDFQYYLSVVGERTKRVGLGTYANGADRQRPMLIFANPLGIAELDHTVTLIHPDDDLQKRHSSLRQVGTMRRTIPAGDSRAFFCYRVAGDVRKGEKQFDLLNPFPSPSRTQKTQARGRFRLGIRPTN